MKKIFMAVAVMIALAGCEPKAYTVSMPMLPAGFEDCKIGFASDGASSMYLARCPNSTTTATYKQGKATVTTITVDGVTYEKKDK